MLYISRQLPRRQAFIILQLLDDIAKQQLLDALQLLESNSKM